MMICLFLTLFNSSILAKGNDKDIIPDSKVTTSENVQVVNEEELDGVHKIRLKITPTNDNIKLSEKAVSSEKTTDAINSTTYAAASVSAFYLDVSIYGSGGYVYGQMYAVGSIPTHNLTISLYSGATTPYTRMAYTTTTKVGSILSPTKVKSAPTSTKVWDVTVNGTINGSNISYETYDFVFNKKAVEYPKYTDSKSGLILAVPATTWTKVANPVAWTSNDLYYYRKYYENAYNGGQPMDWSNLQVHHMKPRAYGGQNSYDNLIPVPTTLHQQTITPWWANY